MKFIGIEKLGLFTILALSIFPCASHAAPSITSVSGTVSHGQTITINGSGFGVKSPVAPQIWADFSGGTVTPSSLSLQSSIYNQSVSVVSSYPTSGYPPYSRAVYGTSLVYGSPSGTSEIGSGAPYGGGYWTKLYNYVKRYYSFDVTSNEKAYRIYSLTSQDVLSSYGDGGRIYSENTPDIGSAGFYGNAGIGSSYQGSRQAAGSWAIEEVRWEVGSGSNGMFEHILNGVQNQYRNNMSNGTSNYNNPIVSNFCAAAPPGGSSVYMADYYIDTTYARVMIGNALTLAASTHREIQIPKTQWIDGQLQVQVSQGSFANGSNAYIFVVDANNIASTGKQITFGSGSVSAPAPSDTTAPTALITNPLAGATVSGTQSVSVSASDNVGVSKVELYVDGVLSSNLTASPFTFSWNTSSVANGSHTLSAKAYDAANNSTVSASVTVTANNAVVDSTAPSVSISAPVSNAIITGNTIVSASASDNVGVARVDFYVDSISSAVVATVSAAPYSFTWDPSTVANGSHTLFAKAFDPAGNSGLSSVAVTVSVPVSTTTVTLKRNECATPPSGTIFCEDFEGTNPKANFNDYDGNPDTENLIVTDSGPAVDSANKAIRLRVPTGQAGGSDLVKVLAGSYDKLYARWYFKYEPGFNFAANNHGGGLWAGDRNFIGQSGTRPTGADFASFSVQYQASTAKPFSYTYNRGMYQDCSNPAGSCYGDSLPCVYDNGASYCIKSQDLPTASLPTLVSGQWYCYEQMVDMGAASTDGSGATGRLTQWVNGNLIGDNTNLWLRTTANLKLQNLWLSLYHHDGTHSVVGELIDNVVVSTQPIGCGAAPALTAPKSLMLKQVTP